MADIRIKDLATTATSAASDDYLALDGSANGTRKILATNVAQNVTDVTFGSSGPSAKSSIAARASRQGLVFDGTYGGTLSALPTFGTSNFSISVWVSHANAASTYETYLGSGTGGLSLLRCPDGSLEISRTNIAAALNSGALSWSTNKFYHVVATSSSQSYAIYRDGVLIASGGTAQSFASGINEVGSHIGNTQRFTGVLSGSLVYNRALSAAEVVALYESGVPAGADYNTASNTAINTSAINNEVASLSGFSSTSTSFSCTATNNGGVASINPSFTMKPGSKYRLTYTYTGSVPLYFVDGAGYSLLLSTGTAVTVEFTYTGTGGFRSAFYPAGSGSVSVTGIAFYKLGLLLAPDAGQAGNGYVWNDVSGNVAQIALPSSGVTWNVPNIATNRIRGTTNTNGNQQLLGSSVLLPAESQILYVRARSRSGTPSITVGTSSGGAEIVASIALSTTWKNLTIALTGGIVSSADDIWIGSNSTDVVETDISWQPLDF